MDIDKIRLLVSISKLYYEEKLSQKEISDKLFISRSHIGRLIKEAKDMGIVSIKIIDPFSEELEYREKLIKKFKLKDALVKNMSDSVENYYKSIAQDFNYILHKYFENAKYIGISAGRTIKSLSEYIKIYNNKSLKFIPLMGGMYYGKEDWSANENCYQFARISKGINYSLNGPMILRSNQAMKELKESKIIKGLLNTYEYLDVIILGISQISSNSTLGKSEMTGEEISVAKESDAKSLICGTFLDKDGNEILLNKSKKFLSIKTSQIKKCPKVIGVAFGEEKYEAIMSVLKSGILDCLVTDLNTSKKILLEV